MSEGYQLEDMTEAKNLYDQMCGYVGANHEKHCVDLLGNFLCKKNDTIQSLQQEVERLRNNRQELAQCVSDWLRWREATMRSEVLPDLPESTLVSQSGHLIHGLLSTEGGE